MTVSTEGEATNLSPSIDYEVKYGNRITGKTDRTRYEILVLIFAFFNKHHITDTALEDLLKLMNVIFGEGILPSSTYMFKKIFENKEYGVTTHIFCQSCLSSISENEHAREKSTFKCPRCEYNQEKSSENSFVSLSIESQLRQIISWNEDSIFNNQQKCSEDWGNIGDITGGETYQSLMERNIIIPKKTITLTINTDGAQQNF